MKVIDTNTEMELITRLRHELHNSPEPSGNEMKTKSISSLSDFYKSGSRPRNRQDPLRFLSL